MTERGLTERNLREEPDERGEGEGISQVKAFLLHV
jgi:hypothetical protein